MANNFKPAWYDYTDEHGTKKRVRLIARVFGDPSIIEVVDEAHRHSFAKTDKLKLITGITSADLLQ